MQRELSTRLPRRQLRGRGQARHPDDAHRAPEGEARAFHVPRHPRRARPLRPEPRAAAAQRRVPGRNRPAAEGPGRRAAGGDRRLRRPRARAAPVPTAARSRRIPAHRSSSSCCAAPSTGWCSSRNTRAKPPRCARRSSRARRVTVLEQDGYAVLKGQLPPTERRGLVLIDPPYESEAEFDAVLAALMHGHERWPTGDVLRLVSANRARREPAVPSRAARVGNPPDPRCATLRAAA